MSLSLHTNFGSLKFELFCQDAPSASFNFLALAAAGVYNGTIFHKSAPGFILQGGDPTGTGKGGLDSYTGAPLGVEVRGKHDKRGILSMASKNSCVGSQFFVSFAPQPDLDGEFLVIGRLISGLTVLTKIEAIPVGKKNRPVTDIVIDRVEIHANPLATQK